MTAALSTPHHVLDPGILREYDIRGVVGKTLSADDAFVIGRAFGTIIRRRFKRNCKVALGYDGRDSSPLFAVRLAEGLAACGHHVEDVGLGPTSMVYFALKERGCDACAIVTGSHSPLAYNGIKMALSTGPFYGPDVQEIGAIARTGDFETGEGRKTQFDIQDMYVARLLGDYHGPRPLRVAWDMGNGASGEIIRRLVKKLPGEHVLLFDAIDGTFPNHHPDPTVAKNLIDLQRAVREHKCDLGVGFDGDADRIGVVDETGDILWADQLMAVYAAEVLRAHPGAPIIADVKSSRVLFDEIARLGGVPVMWNTGHSVIKAKMMEMKSPLGGELAGHICFADKYYGFDDGPYCAVRLLDIVSRSGQKLSALTAHLPKMHNTPEVRFAVPASRKFHIAGEIKARLQDGAAMAGISINDIDGIRVTGEDGWWLVRPSNTEDMLTARVEGFTDGGLSRLKKQLVDQLGLSGIADPFEDFPGGR